ncbi:MAG: L-ribulose-5-phosphate 4-epimerase [Gemmatimonadetes bacterium]|nr:L-ribulose-5-phosphate 4-epimerase [Gemmatimonadota bacterium]
MAYEALREAVWRANLDLVESGLVVLTWGNASAVDRENGVVAIKPSGVAYEEMRPEQMVVVSLEDGAAVDGELRPSSDTPTHLHLYREFPGIGAVVHTHSRHAVSWAQAERDLPCFGTTHADHFHGPVPVTRRMRPEEIRDAYEHNTGVVIVETFRSRGIEPADVPAVLVAGHGPFAWGGSAREAVENGIVLEAVAGMALNTLTIKRDAAPIDRELLDKHFMRKHGKDAYYGQESLAP